MREGVTLVIADLGGGGAQRVLTFLVKHWVRENRPVHVITLACADSDFFKLPAEVRRISLDAVSNSSGLLAGLAANVNRLNRLRRALRATGTHTVISFVGVTNIMIVLAAVGLSRRIIISERNDPQRQSLGFPWTALRRWVYPRASLVTANSQNAIDGLSEYVPAERLKLVKNPVWIPPMCDQGGREKVILAVGRLTRQKGIDVLLDAFAKVHRSHPQWQLRIVGDGKAAPALKAQAERLNIASAVDWCGHVRDLDEHYSSASIFALPSRHEGMPNALLEAMSWGCAVIVSDTSGGALEIVRNEETGLVVPGESPKALSAAINRLIEQDSFCAELGRTAREAMKEQHVEKILEEWDRIIDPPGTVRS